MRIGCTWDKFPSMHEQAPAIDPAAHQHNLRRSALMLLAEAKGDRKAACDLLLELVRPAAQIEF
jgi:hypothetical protein